MSYCQRYLIIQKITRVNNLDYKVICCSKYIKNLYKSDFGWKKTTYIYQTINTYFIDRSINKKLIKKIKSQFKDQKIILAPGRIDNDKNHLTILKSINILKKDNLKFKIIIIGEKGNSFKQIKKYIANNKIEKFVDFIPLIKFEIFLNWLVAADLVILNSSQEPIGGIAFENMYLKTNYIISYQTGWKEIIINNKDGNVINNTFDELEIYKRIKFVLSNRYKESLKKKNKEFIFKNFNNFKISENWIRQIKHN